MAQGGGGYGIVAMAEMNWTVELCWRRAAMAKLRWCCGGARSGAAEMWSEREKARVAKQSEQQGRNVYVCALA